MGILIDPPPTIDITSFKYGFSLEISLPTNMEPKNLETWA
jgi:hypothetical protein